MKLIPIPTTVEHVDMNTGKVTVKPTTMHMLPAAPGKCPECAVDHPPEQPHNAQSLFYQMQFHGAHQRWPTWKDAVAHCSPDVAASWEAHLRSLNAWTEPVPPPPPETHETPIPKDALVELGAEMDVLDQSDNVRKTGKVMAIVPAGVPFAFAEADQNGEPRPRWAPANRKRTTTYIIDVTHPETNATVRWHVPQRDMKKGMDPEANRKARETI